MGIPKYTQIIRTFFRVSRQAVPRMSLGVEVLPLRRLSYTIQVAAWDPYEPGGGLGSSGFYSSQTRPVWDWRTAEKRPWLVERGSRSTSSPVAVWSHRRVWVFQSHGWSAVLCRPIKTMSPIQSPIRGSVFQVVHGNGWKVFGSR